MKAQKAIIIALGIPLALAFAAAVILWLVAMPPRNLPEPTGPYYIASHSFDLPIEGRRELYDENSVRDRIIRVQLWYPVSAAPSGRRLPWMADGLAQIRGIVSTHGFPFFIWDHTLLMRSNSRQASGQLPAAAGEGSAMGPGEGGRGVPPEGNPAGLPVVLISHGWEGYRGLHADVAEELASHGYLVAAMDHSYGAAATVLDSGERYRSSARVLPGRNESPDFPAFANRLVSTFSRDSEAVLDFLERLNAGGSGSGYPELAGLRGQIDLSRLGVVGHSTGGGAMVNLVLDNPRLDVDALVGLDAWVEPVGSGPLESGVYETPSLFLRSAQWEGGINDGYLLPFVERLNAQAVPVQLYQIEGSTHQQFTTLYMYRPVVKMLGMLGEVDPMGFMEFQRTAVLGHMNRHLKGIPGTEDAVLDEVSARLVDPTAIPRVTRIF